MNDLKNLRKEFVNEFPSDTNETDKVKREKKVNIKTEEKEVKVPVKRKRRTKAEIEQAEAEDERVQVLKVSQFDVAAKKRALNASVDIKKHEMPFFKESIGINEKTRRDIIQAKNSGNQTIIEHLMKKGIENYERI